MVGLIFIGIVVGVLLFALDNDPCPRMILGYDCQGKRCDHSSEELHRARIAMSNNIEKGKPR